jgi:hypothetical protein
MSDLKKALLLMVLTIHVARPGSAQTSDPELSVVSDVTYHTNRPIQQLSHGRGVSSAFEVDFSKNWKWLSIRFNPRVWAVENRFTPLFPVQSLSSVQLIPYEKAYGQIDLIERYGSKGFQKSHLGDSRIALRHRRVQLGVSSEGRRWGAGERQQLLLSDYGLGFSHAFVEFDKVPLGIASLSMDVIGGRLDSSGFARYPMPDEWRLISGLNLRVSPSFIPGLDVGLNRIFVQNASQVETVYDAFPFLQPFEKAELGDGTDGSGSQPDNQLAAVFFRWRFDESRMTVYGEYARDDHSMDLRDALMEPDHMRAYILGVRKGDEKREIGVELVNVTQVNPKSLRASGWWYTNNYVRHGHTHLGQVLGAEIGPGSRSQEFWLRSHQTEISLRRVDVDRDLFNAAFSTGSYRPEVDWIIRARTVIGKGTLSASPEVSLRHTRNRFYIHRNHETSVGVGLRLSWRFAPGDQ